MIISPVHHRSNTETVNKIQFQSTDINTQGTWTTIFKVKNSPKPRRGIASSNHFCLRTLSKFLITGRPTTWFGQILLQYIGRQPTMALLNDRLDRSQRSCNRTSSKLHHPSNHITVRSSEISDHEQLERL